MTTANYNLTACYATVHLIFHDYDLAAHEVVDNIFSIPAKVTSVQDKAIIVEELGDSPKQYRFYLNQAPNGAKSWAIDPSNLNGADEVRLTLSHS